MELRQLISVYGRPGTRGPDSYRYGCGQGIGREIATTLAAEGADVVAADIDAENASETVSLIEDGGESALFVETDVTETASVRSMVDETIEAFGSIDVLVNNAGGSLDDDVAHAVDPESWKQIVDLNLTGPYICTHEVLPAMVESGGGSIVFVSSANALTGIGLPAYSAAKTDYTLFAPRRDPVRTVRHPIERRLSGDDRHRLPTRATRRRLGRRVPRATPRSVPDGEFGTPEDVANAVLYLSSDLARFVSGTELAVDGGLTCGLDQTFQRTLYDVDRLE